MSSNRLLFLGDFAPDRNQQKLIMEDGWDPFEALSDKISAADLSILNLEAPLTESRAHIQKTGPCLAIAPDVAAVISSRGIDACSLANNHIGDFGASGVSDTLKACEAAGLQSFGAGLDLEHARQPLIFRGKAGNIALIAVAEHEFNIATAVGAGASPLSVIENIRQIRSLRSQVDYIVISVHGGVEHMQLPPLHLRDTCRFFIEEGADAVVCHHSHVPGASEIYKKKPIFYGLGNLMMPKKEERPLWSYGYAVQLKFEDAQKISSDMHPYKIAHDRARIEALASEDYSEFRDTLEKVNQSLRCEEEYLRSISDWYYQASKGLNLLFLPKHLRMLARIPFGKEIIKKIHRDNGLGKLNVLRCQSHREILIVSYERFLEGKKLHGLD